MKTVIDSFAQKANMQYGTNLVSYDGDSIRAAVGSQIDLNNVGRMYESILRPEGRIAMAMDSNINSGLSASTRQFFNVGDANIDTAGAYFARSLEAITKKAYDIVHPELKARGIFGATSDAGPGDLKVTSTVYENFGIAEEISMAGGDIPNVSIGGKEISYPIVPFGIAGQYTLQQVHAYEASVRNGRTTARSPIENIQIAAAYAVDAAIDRQVWYGSEGTEISGFINNPYIPTIASSTGTGGSTKWQDKTAEEIIEDITNLTNTMFSSTKQKEVPDTMLLSPELLIIIENKKIAGATGSVMTVLQYILTHNRFFKNRPEAIIAVNEYSGAGYDGTDLVSIVNTDVEKMGIEIPQDTTPIPMQVNGFMFKNLWYAYSAGLLVRFPRAAIHMEGC